MEANNETKSRIQALSERMAALGADPALSSVEELSTLTEGELAVVEKKVTQLEVEREYGPGARAVEPYQPSRKQRRAQAARKRRTKS